MEEYEFKVYRNFKITPKILGTFETKTFIFTSILGIILFKIMSYLKINIWSKIQILLIICAPLYIISMNGDYSENPLYIISFLIKFIFGEKEYINNSEKEEKSDLGKYVNAKTL